MPREQSTASSSPPLVRDDGDTRPSTHRSRPSPIIHPQSVSSSSISSTASSSAVTLGSTATPRRDGPSPSVSKRSSFAENLNLRSYPSSPRAQRTLSFSGPALQELLMSPSYRPSGDDARFAGRDWRTIQVSEIIDHAETRFVEYDTSIEDTTKLLVRSGAPNVVLVRESRKTKTPIDTFDFSDLNAYLLLVLGMTQPDEEASQIAERTRAGDVIPLRDVTNHLGAREEPIFISHTATLNKAMEVLGGGHHRVIVCKEGTTEAVGILSQLRLVRFFWENHQNFATTEQLYSRPLRDLELGAKDVLAINGDKPLADALRLMHNEGITSLPVLDGQRNVVGNISHVDVRLLTDTSAIPLLSATCIHFISVILSERGLYDGKDAYPVFHVTPFSTLAHTVAKLCATRSHRMWIVDAPSPSTSVPPSPGLHHRDHHPHLAPSTPSISTPHPVPPSPSLQPPPSPAAARHGATSDATPGPPYTSVNPAISVSAAQLPGQGMSGRLTGVVSLTDILNLFARATGLSPADPEETRRRRRQSSSASARPSFDFQRPSAEILRAAGAGGTGTGGGGTNGLGRSSSSSSRR